MLITKTNPLNGYVNTINVPISQEKLNEFRANPHKCVQEILPNLPAKYREFLQTGIWEFEKFVKDPDMDPELETEPK